MWIHKTLPSRNSCCVVIWGGFEPFDSTLTHPGTGEAAHASESGGSQWAPCSGRFHSKQTHMRFSLFPGTNPDKEADCHVFLETPAMKNRTDTNGSGPDGNIMILCPNTGMTSLHLRNAP